MAEQEALAWGEQQDVQSDDVADAPIEARVCQYLCASVVCHKTSTKLASRDPLGGLSAIGRHVQPYADMQGDTVILETSDSTITNRAVAIKPQVTQSNPILYGLIDPPANFRGDR